MKKNYLLSIIAVCTCLFTACNKEIDTPQTEGSEEKNEGVITYIRATGNENESKGSIDGDSGSFYWNEGDQIAVWNNGAYQSSIALSAEAGDIVGEKPANATFRFSGELNNRANFAVFPASIADGDHATSSDFSISLKGTYTLDEVAGEKSPVPMIAVNDGDNLHFKQLGALLRITLNNLPPSTKSVTIDFNGKKVWGSFPVASTVVPGSSNIVTAAATGDDTGKDVITINITGDHGWIDNQDVNIPVPTGTYTTITVKSWTVANGGGTNTLTMTRWIKVASGISSNWNPIRTSARKVIASLPAFSVSSSKRVVFSPANLIVNGETYSFQDEPWLTTFAHVTGQNNEYPEFVTYTADDPDDAEQVAEAEEKTIASSNARRDAILATANRDLFKWDELIDAGKSKDFVIDGYHWYLGSKDEWEWMLKQTSSNRRTYNKTYHSYARVILPTTPTTGDGFPDCTRTNWLKPGSETNYNNAEFRYDGETGDVLTWGGTPGLFIFPDEWDNALSTVTISNFQGTTPVNYDKDDPKAMEINQAVFQQLVDAGAIFIPGVGVILMDGSPAKYNFSSLGVCAGSWSSTEATDAAAYDISTSIKAFTLSGSYGKASMRTVRLVRDIPTPVPVEE